MTRWVISFVAALAVASGLALGPFTAGGSSQTPAPPTGILCLDKAGANYVVKAKPGKCAAFGPNEIFGGGVNLIRLRWRGWGTARASARGIECGFHLPCSRIKVKVVAFAPVTSCTGQLVYSRIRAKSRFGHSVVPPRSCPGPVPIPSF
jgi:hypothetical protein